MQKEACVAYEVNDSKRLPGFCAYAQLTIALF
jgi:hypothetical protein